MANRRMLSKSISTSKRINRLDEFSQLVFTWLIPHTDDFGRMDGDPEIVKAIVMPLSKRKEAEFFNTLKRLYDFGLIAWYVTEGQAVIEIINFENHQANLHKRNASKFPNWVDGVSQNFWEAKTVLPESPRNSGKVRPNRTEQNLTEPNRTVEQARPAEQVSEIFECWKEELQHPKALLDPTRDKAIRGRLQEGYTVERIKQAVRGIKKSPHNMGQNDRNTKFDDIELICRSGKNVDRFADMDAYKPPPAPIPEILTKPPPTAEELEANAIRAREARKLFESGKILKGMP